MLGVIDEGTRLETGAGNPAVRSTHATHADTTLLQQQRGLAAWDQGRSEHAIPDHAMASEYTSRSELLTHPSTGIYSGNDNGSFYGGCHQLASRLQPYASAPNPETWGLQEDAASKRDAQPHGVMTSAPFAMPLQNHSEALRQHLAMLRHAQRQHAALHLHPHAHRAMQLQHSHPHTPVWPHGAMRGHTADTSNPSLAAWSQRPPSAAGALVPRAGAAAAAPASHLQTTRAATDGSPLSGTDSGQVILCIAIIAIEHVGMTSFCL